MASGQRNLGWGIGRGPGRGWLLVATLAVTETTSYGVLAYAFGVFLLPMQQELGWSRTALTGAYSLAIIVSGVAAIPVGRWLDRHGPRALMTSGAAAASLLVLAWAHVTDLTAFYGIWLGIGLTMAAVLYEPAFAVIATWFRDGAQRTRALLGLTVVAGFASVIYVPLAGWLVQTLGWRHALVVLAALLAVLTVLPNATLPGRRPDHVERPAHDQATRPVAVGYPAGVGLRRALGDQALWWLAAALVAATLATTSVTVHLVAYLREQGYSAGFAATWTGLLGAGSVGGPILVTVLGRRWPLATATAAIFAVQALAVIILLGLPGSAGVVAFVALFGLGVGLISLARAALVAELYGVAAYASINGVLALPSRLPEPPPRSPRRRSTPRPGATGSSWSPSRFVPWSPAWPWPERTGWATTRSFRRRASNLAGIDAAGERCAAVPEPGAWSGVGVDGAGTAVDGDPLSVAEPGVASPVATTAGDAVLAGR